MKKLAITIVLLIALSTAFFYFVGRQRHSHINDINAILISNVYALLEAYELVPTELNASTLKKDIIILWSIRNEDISHSAGTERIYCDLLRKKEILKTAMHEDAQMGKVTKEWLARVQEGIKKSNKYYVNGEEIDICK